VVEDHDLARAEDVGAGSVERDADRADSADLDGRADGRDDAAADVEDVGAVTVDRHGEAAQREGGGAAGVADSPGEATPSGSPVSWPLSGRWRFFVPRSRMRVMRGLPPAGSQRGSVSSGNPDDAQPRARRGRRWRTMARPVYQRGRGAEEPRSRGEERPGNQRGASVFFVP
jgi:hypothetical protein